jgi:tight adherence protein B
MNLLDNPIFTYTLIGISVLLLSWYMFSLIFFKHEALQKKNLSHQRQDTPMSHFISPEALKQLQSSIAMWIILLGTLLMVACHFYFGILFVIVVAVGGYALPKLYFQYQVEKRNLQFDIDMMDFVILVSNSLRGGLAMPAAIEMSIQTLSGPVREEFSRALSEHRLGLSLPEALSRINQRIDSENLKLFTATVSVTMATGGSAANILDNVVKTIRMRNEFQDKLRNKTVSLKGEAKMTSLIPLFFIGVMFLSEPDFIMPLFVNPLGWCALAAVAVFQIIGYFILKEITNIEV